MLEIPTVLLESRAVESNHAYVVIMSSIQQKRPSVGAEVRPSSEGSAVVQDVAQMSKWAYFKHYVTSRDGWLGDYVSPGDGE